MASAAKILSWRFRFLKRRPTKEGGRGGGAGVTGTPGTPLATPLCISIVKRPLLCLRFRNSIIHELNLRQFK